MAELEALKQQLQQVAMTGRALTLRSQHAATILAELERIPELEQENAEIHNKLVDAAERAERLEAAAQHLLDVLTAEPYEEAEAALRAALADAPAPAPEAQPCPTCDGCGQVADTEDQEPWTAWLDLPVKSAAAVLTGLVKPIPCPTCGAPAEESDSAR